ncbi:MULTISPECIES: hypothetical protein [Cryobacterium]|uniref:hypothetical protein n=1 Tax=Cryobacterium TaxID=69578 RepID=UPI00135854E3|nr:MULTISPECIES: hypothetical protein [Cryobacterium]
MNVIYFIISMAVFTFGLWLFGFAFEAPTLQAPLFIGGVLVVSLAVAIPVQILRD